MKRTEPQQVREELEQLLTQASAADRDGHSLSLILLDVDEFRKVNEMYGHGVGDQVLADLARIVPQYIREQDTFVRCGGEEYAIVAPGMALAEAGTMAETIRSAVENHVFPETGRVTISLGLIAYRAGDIPVDMIRRVYEAVGQAKASGRNRIQIAS